MSYKISEAKIGVTMKLITSLHYYERFMSPGLFYQSTKSQT